MGLPVSDDPLAQVNRALISVAALLVIFVATLVVLVAWVEPGTAIDRLDDFAGWLRDHQTNEAKLILSLGALVAVLFMLGVLIIELTPSPLERMRVRGVQAGEATIRTVEIADRIVRNLREMEDIAEADAIVAVKRGKVEIVLDLQVQPGAVLAQTADEACRRAHRLVEGEIGVAMASLPRARLHYRELHLQRRAVQQSSEDAAAGAARPPSGWERPQGIDDGGN